MADYTLTGLGTVQPKTVPSTRMQHTSVVWILKTMFSSVDHGSGTVNEYNMSDLMPSTQTTPIANGHKPELAIGNGRRPVYGQQYPRGYYNK
jgi:hypothetical protein|tara:strand:- start:148 stop:423 length:276 start_codon:yes stop_codon:yes gene_type:complete